MSPVGRMRAGGCSGHEATKSPIAEEALRRIGELYAVEAAINGQSPEQRRAARQAKSKPLLEALHAWMLEQRRRLSGKSTLGKALQYALNRWDALVRYVEDGRLSIDNNLSERLLRGIAVTRKNFLFVGSDAGGQRAAIIYTIAETAKLNGLDPEAYIAAVLDRLAAAIPSAASISCSLGTSRQTVNLPVWADAYGTASAPPASRRAPRRSASRWSPPARPPPSCRCSATRAGCRC